MTLIYSFPVSLKLILTIFYHLRFGLPSSLFTEVFPPNLYVFMFSPVRATCPAHLILLCFITLITLGEAYKSLLRTFFQPPIASFAPNVFAATHS